MLVFHLLVTDRMRRIVKRLLKKYDYPPEGQEDALSTIMKQCDMWSENS